MYYALRPNFIGRDRFIETFRDLGFRIKRHKTVYAPSMIWQSDITHIYVGERFYYTVFIIDIYTKKIVGYQLSNHMRATANVKAMQMALESNEAPMIHHSDRGSQYIYNEYITLLKVSGCEISMALSGQDNAYAERINRTIKEEYIDHWKPKTFEQLKKDVDRAVEHYNYKRPHNNIGRLSPVDFEDNWFNNNLFSKPIITIFDNENLIKIGQL